MKEDCGLTNNVGKNKKALDNSGSVGTGLTNGSVMDNKVSNKIGNNGFTNGMGGDGLDFPSFDGDLNSKKNKRRKKKSKTFKFIGIIIIVILMVAINYMVVILPDETITLTIDNDYREWTNLTDIGFGNFGVKEDRNTLYMTLQKDDILKGTDNITESYLIFINDVASNDGYHIGYGSYEYYIDIYGYNNSIENAIGYQFDSTKNNSDWNGFTSGYSSFRISSANNQDQLEFSLHPIQMGFTNISGLELLIFHYDTIGNYEYSQVIDVDVIKQVGLSDEGTRAEPKLSYYHIFEKNELHIVTEDSLAYNSIPYNIRIIQNNIPVNTTPLEPLQPSQEQVEPQEYESRDMEITLTISYEFWEDDIIRQCGGHIYETTVENMTFSDQEIILYQINKTVTSILMEGDFGYSYITGDSTRSSGDIILNEPINPIIHNPANISHCIANGLNSTYPTIDGELNDPIWDNSEVDTYYMDSVRDFELNLIRNETYCFFGILSMDDTTSDNDDACYIYFDVDYARGNSPNKSTYKRISYTGGGTITYYEGNGGGGWGSQTVPLGWDVSKSMTDGKVSFEFIIPLSDLNENYRFDTENETIGFGVKVMDWKVGGGNTHRDNMWYPDAYYSGITPSTEYMDEPDNWVTLIYGSDNEVFGSITSMKANEYDTTEQDITVDGVLDEYFWGRIPTDDYYIDVASDDMKIFTVRNDTHVFVGVWASEDASQNSADSCNVYFDTDNDETTTPDADDKRLSINGAGTITYYEGDGSIWSSTSTPSGWDAGESVTGTSNIVTYEFVIPISDLNENGQFNPTTSTIGFGVRMHDLRQPAQTSYTWYPDNVYIGSTPTTEYMDKPDTWADLEYGDDFTGTEFLDYDLYAMPMSDTITIDGDLDESAWTTYADDWTIDCNGHDAILYTMRDSTYLYIGWYSKSYDTVGVNDFCQIYFDTDYDGTLDPDTADKLLQIGDDNVTAYFEGTGTGWAGATMPTNWAGSNGATTGNISWEARFTISELDDNGNFGASGEKIGFGITVGHSANPSDSYTVSYPDACEHDFEMSRYKYHPESWSDLIFTIPEFSDYMAMGIFMMVVGIAFIRKRKDKITLEERGDAL